MDSKLNQTDIKYSDIMKLIDKRDKYPHMNYKPNRTDPTKINIPANTPSLLSFQNRNLTKIGENLNLFFIF